MSGSPVCLDGKVLMVMVRSSIWVDVQKTHVFPLFLEVPRRQPAGMCAVHGLLDIWREI